ncbi:ATP-grasp domain-containing protein [Lachnoclostridium phytofermentans]|uniref:RimK domain protein ATP-grasp n=1 Tax=Lachnoclostridium phytofermentans (strain ATCC 700394 / DSM 18823 / ISDg) TaxID=357809 RepID=A9KNJ6_LACP7|nr:ATP-grasp domain-containing protein [Lachnoclostridium phytofermentans]ABX43113.1 RimK domain protein ATP-grasp [Lachnoclostridium phytofermentans ISDg]
MLIWMIYQEADAKKNEWYIKEHQKIGKSMGLEIELKLVENLEIGVSDGKLVLSEHKKIVEPPKAAIIRTIWPLLSEHLEAMGTRVFNSAFISSMCNDKARTYREISKLNIQVIPTEFVKKENLSRKVAMETKPCIVKSVDGHGGSEVFLIETEDYQDDLSKILSLKSNDFVIQPYIEGKKQDLRVYVFGKKILGCILRTANHGFKSNFSLGGAVCEYHLKSEEYELVQKIIDAYAFDLVGVDFLVDEKGNLIFNEIEDVVGARMLYQCTTINLVEEYLDYIKNELSF